MSWVTIRSDRQALRALLIGGALCWSVAFVVVALYYQLQLYADGAMFSYAVAVQDVWAFHWHNISGRLTVFLLSLWPAELYVGLTGNPSAGIFVYGLLFYLAPLVGLIGTFVADRSRNRIIFVYACFSTAILCPLIFGFPTEIWLAHALFWPTLAVSHYAKCTITGALLVLLLMFALVFTHEGALIFAGTIVATVALRGWRDARFLRAGAVFLIVTAAAVVIKIMLPPDNYYSEVFLRAALHFFDLSIFEASILLIFFAVLVGYAATFFLLWRGKSGRAYIYAFAIMAVGLAIYRQGFDHSIHASSRYYLRTALVIVTPAFGVLAALFAISGEGRPVCSRLERAMAAMFDQFARPLAATFLLLMLVHVIETGKFVTEWQHYREAVAALATGEQSDPGLGDPRFVSSRRIVPDLNRLSWFSTTPYLSVLVANFTPNRLVIDPSGNYFWLSCATATENADSFRAAPAKGRDLIRVYSCLHR